MNVARCEAVDLRGFCGGEVVFFKSFLNGVDAEVDSHGLEVSKVNGRGLWWAVHEVASGMDGSTRDFLGCTNWVECEEVVVVEFTVVCVSGGGVVTPWCGVLEDAIECGSGCKRYGNMQGEVNLTVWKIGCVVVGQGGVNLSNVCNFLIVSDGVQPLWRRKAHDLCDPYVFPQTGQWGCREEGTKGRGTRFCDNEQRSS